MIKWKKSEHIYEIKILADWKVFSKSTSICSIYNHREINEKVLTAFIVSSPRLRNFPEARFLLVRYLIYILLLWFRKKLGIKIVGDGESLRDI